LTSDLHPIPHLDRKGLREFGLVTGGMFAGLFGLFFPWLLGVAYPLWPWIVFAVLGSAGLLIPEALRPVHHWWMRFALMISKVTTPLILAVVFFLVFTPIGLFMKIFGKDAMRRKIDDTIDSYRVASKGSAREDLEKPF
jgi:hypothetical protein